MIVVRSLAFFLAALLATMIYGLPVIVGSFIGRGAAYAAARQWCQLVLWLARVVVGIRHEVRGLANMPSRAAVAMVKHQSAWETLLMPTLLPPQTWIVKKELLWLPIVGQCIQALRGICIDRKAGKAAREQIVEQGTQRLSEGMWVVVFPEGTRTAPGERKRYGIGGALLACAAGAPIVPIAHNAGEFWRRYAFLKYPGTVVVSIGPTIETAGRDAVTVIAETEAWVESEMTRISNVKPQRDVQTQTA